MSAARVRPVRHDDRDAIARIAEATNLFPPASLDAMLSGYLHEASDDVWLVAEVAGAIEGVVFCEPERFTNGTWNMRALGVQPAVQRSGVGTALTTALEQVLRVAGQRVLIVETAGTPDYAHAVAFYLAQGYGEQARIRDFWDAGVDKVVLAKHPSAGT